MFVDGITSGLTAFRIADQQQDQMMAAFVKQPTVQRDIDYWRQNIGSVHTVDDLLNNQKLLNIALSAFQLEDEASAKGILKKLMTQDPTQQGSLAQQLADPRFRQFAAAFSSLGVNGGDNGAAISTLSSTDTVINGYITNSYEKALGQTNTSVRQALYFQRTLTDTIDVSNLNGLLTQFQKSPAFSGAIQYYKDNIGKVATPDDLLNDNQLLTVALSAFHLDSLINQPDTVRTLLTQDPTAQGSLASADPTYMNFAKAFQSLQGDGGAALHADVSVNAVISAFTTNEFEQTLETPSAQKGVFDSLGQGTAAALVANFAKEPAITGAEAYFRNNIGSVSSVKDLLGNTQLLDFALSAFHLDSLANSPDTITQLITQDPNAAGSLASSDPRYMAFAQAFAPLGNGGRVDGAHAIDPIVAGFESNEFLKSINSKVQQATTGTGALSMNAILGDKTLSAVVRGAFNLPLQVGALDPTQQTAALQRLGFDPAKLQDPKALNNFISRFLANDDMSKSTGDPMLALFQPPDNSGGGNGTVDLSGLLNLVV